MPPKSDRTYLVRFEGDAADTARIELIPKGSKRQPRKGEFMLDAPSAQRAELIARAMRKKP